MALASALEIDEEKALDIFYSTETYRQLSDAKYGLQLMSDGYILENVISELKSKERILLLIMSGIRNKVQLVLLFNVDRIVVSIVLKSMTLKELQSNNGKSLLILKK